MPDSNQVFGNHETKRPLADASTVILIRPGAPFEVFLVKRHQKSAFMGGLFVFPGGKLDPEDGEAAMLDRTAPEPGTLCARLDETPGRPLDPPVAAGLYVAACRELFEEAGVLLARRRREVGPIAFAAADVEAHFSGLRAALRAGTTSFAEIVSSEDLILDLGSLTYYAHWITPSRERRRYDTRFFIAAMPEGQTALIDHQEVTEQAWQTPEAALRCYEAGEIGLAPPTLRTLEELAELESIAALQAFAAARRIAPILPKVAATDGRIAILLPWDPLYAGSDGESLDLEAPHPMAEGPTRFVLDGERWVSVHAGA